MSNPRRVRLCLLSVLAGCGLLLGVLAAQASAESYGELSRFSAGVESAGKAHAFGVDTAEANTIFIGSEPNKSEYVIKKFSAAGKELAKVTIKPSSAEFPEGAKGIEGIAIYGKRLFVLVLSGVVVNLSRGGTPTPDAGALYAFSTEQVGSALVPASGITNGEGLFASTATLHASSKTISGSREDPLIEPSGVAFDPKTNEVIVLGFDEESSTFPRDTHVALQRVAIGAGAPAGELGARYINPDEDGEGEEPDVNSPVVSAGGNVFYSQQERHQNGAEELLQVPTSFAAVAPKVAYETFANPSAEHLDEQELLVEFPAELTEGAPVEGAALSYTPEGGGRIYSYAEIAEDEELETSKEKEEPLEAEFESTQNPGVLALSYQEHEEEAAVAEIGFTGGQRPARVVKGTPEEVKCSLGPAEQGSRAYPMVAAGSGETLFVLGWTVVGKVDGVETKKPIVEEFGPKTEATPKECLEAHGPMLAETDELEVVAETQAVPAGAELALTSYIFDGNALKVEWSFDEGTPPSSRETDEHQESKISHLFEGNEPGEGEPADPGGLEPTVVEKIHTDNLAYPSIEIKRKVKLKEELPVVHKSPGAATEPEGGKAIFTARASGGNMKVQWQVEKGGTGSFEKDTTDGGDTTNTLTVNPVKAADNGNKYRAAFENGKDPANPVISAAATLTVSGTTEKAPEVTKQPVSVEVVEGSEAKFEAEASGMPAPTVQWYESTNQGVSFSSVSGATSDVLKIAGTTPVESGDEYKAVFKNTLGKAETTAATLTVTTKPVAPKITKQPVSVEVVEGSEAKFEAEASGIPTPRVQWYESTNKGVSFSPVTGATSDTLKIASTTLVESGDEYRAVFTNVASEATSETVTLTVKAPPKITKQPVSVGVVEGSEAKVEAEASGDPTPAVQWEVSTNKGVSFSPVSGATSDVLKIASTTPVESGDEYKAVFKNTLGEAETTAATLTVTAKPVVVPKMPENPVTSIETKKAEGEQGVKGVTEGSPETTLSGVSLSVNRSGAFVMKVGCSGANVTSCSDAVTLRTLNAVVASIRAHQSKAKASILTLATAAVTVDDGQTKSVTLHLSAKARALLARAHSLRARATIVARDPQGGVHTTVVVVTLRLAKRAQHH